MTQLGGYRLRAAAAEDLAPLTAIYHEAVLHSTATFDLHPASRESWLHFHLNNSLYPLLVAVSPDGQVAGYGTLSPYREKEAYISTVELSIYVHTAHRRRGVATLLMQGLLNACEAQPQIHLAVSVITAGNQPSERLHRRFGFTLSGTLPQCGRKFGRWLSVETWWKVTEAEAETV